MRELLFIALVLACPLVMVFMMRGGHGHGGNSHAGGCHNADGAGYEHDDVSTDDLHRRRDQVDRLIAEREQAEKIARETLSSEAK